MANQVNTGSTVPPAAKPPRHRRRRWLWAGLIIIGVLVVLVLALPSLLCTGPGVRLVEAQINARIHGTASIGELSLGWFTPAHIHNLTLRDQHGAVVLGGVNVETQLSLWRALTNHQQLGKISLVVQRVHLAARRNGTLNLMTILTGQTIAPHPASSPPSTEAPSALVSGVRQPQPLAAGASQWPPLSVGLDCRIKRLSWTGHGVPTLQVRNLNLALALDTAGKPLQLSFSSQVSLPKEAPTKVVANATLTIFRQQQLLSTGEMSGHINLDLHHLDLRAANTILASLGQQLRMQGMLNMHLALVKTAPAGYLASARRVVGDAMVPQLGGSVQGQVNIQGFVLGGSMLRGDTPHFGDVNIPVKVSWGGERFSVAPVAVHCGLGDFSVQGGGDIAALQAVLNHLPTGAAQAIFQIQAGTQLAALVRQLPHYFQTPLGMKIQGGRAKLTANIALGRPTAVIGADGAAAEQFPAVDAPSGPSGSAEKGSASATVLPAVAAKLNFSMRSLRWYNAGDPTPQIANAAGDVAFNTAGQPVDVRLNLAVTHGALPPISILLQSQVAVFHQQRILPLDQLTGSLHLEAHKFNLSYVHTLMPSLKLPLQVGGVLNGSMDIRAPRPGQGVVTGQLQIDQLTCQGPMLKSDHPQFGRLVIPIDLAWKGDSLQIHRLGLQNQLVSFLATGSTRMSSLQAMLHRGTDWGRGSLSFSSACNLGLLAANLPQTLAIAPMGLNLSTGHLTISGRLDNLNLNSSGVVNLKLDALAGTFKKQKFHVNPLQAQAAFGRSGMTWNFNHAQLAQASDANATTPAATQLFLHLASSPAAQGTYTLQLNADLAPLFAEVAPLANLRGRSAAGVLSLTLEAQHIQTPKITYTTNVRLQNMALVLQPGAAPIRETSVLLQSHGTIKAPQRHLQSVAADFSLRTAELGIPHGSILLRQKPSGALETAKLHLQLDHGSLAGLAKLLKPFAPALQHYQLAGAIGNSTVALAYAPGKATISQCHLVLHELSLAGAGSDSSVYQEPQLTLDLAAQAHTTGAIAANLKQFSLQTTDGAANIMLPRPASLTQTKAGGMLMSCPAVKIDSNLPRLQPLLMALGIMKAGEKLQGQLTLSGQVKTSGQDIVLGLQSTVKNYQLTAPNSSLTLPPTNIAADIQGNFNPVAKTFAATGDCGVSETAVQGGGADKVQLAKGSVVALTPATPENVHLQVDYDLTRLASLMRPLLPKGLVMTGRHSMQLHITGRLTKEPGLKQIRDLTIAPLSFAFDKLSINGVNLGPGAIRLQQQKGVLTILPSRIPANEGQLNLAGQIDLNRPTPIFSLNQPLQLADNIQLNSTLSGTLLNFIPLTWGAPSDSGNGVKVQGVLNLNLTNTQLPLQYQQLQETGTLAGTFSVSHLTTDSPLYQLISNVVQPLGSLNGNTMQVTDSGISETSFHLQQGKLYYQNMNVMLVSYGMNFSGWVALNKQLDVNVGVSGSGITLPIPLEITGTTDKPNLHLSGKPLKNVGQTLQQLPNILNRFLGH